MDVEENASMIITPSYNFALVVRTDGGTKGDMILKMMGRCISQGSARNAEPLGGGIYIWINISLHIWVCCRDLASCKS